MVEARGQLRLRKESGAPAALQGRIEALRGKFGYYGRLFEVEEGRVDFDGQAPPQPWLNARGLYIERTTQSKIRVQLEGPWNKLKLSLSSEPPMEERDILSVLVFGKPLDQVGQGSRDAGGAAAEKLIAGYLSNRLRGKLNLDILELEPAGAQRPGITVGRYLTKDLFLSYGIDPRGQRDLGVEYTLNPRWSLEGKRSSDGRYVLDVFLRRGFR